MTTTKMNEREIRMNELSYVILSWSNESIFFLVSHRHCLVWQAGVNNSLVFVDGATVAVRRGVKEVDIQCILLK